MVCRLRPWAWAAAGPRRNRMGGSRARGRAGARTRGCYGRAGGARMRLRGKPWGRPYRIEDMDMKGNRRGPSDPEARRRAGLGAIAGLLAAATALGVGQLVAGLTGANGSPVVAVGQLQIDFTPPWLKNFAINEFGSDDKLVLVSGILVVLGIFAAVIGVAAARRLGYGMAGLVVFAVIGLTAAATRPTASVASLLPTLAATAAAAIALRVLIGRIGPPSWAGASAAPRAWGDTGEA